MRADIFEVPVAGIVYRVESPKLKDGLKATVTAFQDDEPVHNDRLNLDIAKARHAFATAVIAKLSTDEQGEEQIKQAVESKAMDLLTVRETIMDTLTVAPAGSATEEEIDSETMESGRELLSAPEILDQAAQAIKALGYSAPDGAGHLTKIVFLALVSRLLVRPLNLVVAGPSSAGKSFLVSTVSRLFPADAVYALSGMSERLLAYTDADLQHKMLIIGEASALHRDGIGASLLRTIAWEGKLSYETVEKTNDGLKARRIEKPGPTGFITTTTGQIEAELNTRVLEITVPDTPAATKIILKATAERANGKALEEPDLSVWIAAQRWLETEGLRGVTIPYAEELAERVPAEQVRMRRDFTQLLTLIQAHAVLYQRQRDTSDDGRIIATIDDYEAVYEIVAPLFQAIAADGITPQVRETVEAVKDLNTGPDDTATVLQVAQKLEIDKSAASRRIKRAVKAGFLINLEDKRGRPLKLRTGDPLPDNTPALPDPIALNTNPTRNRATVQPQGEIPRGGNENGDSVACNRDATTMQPLGERLQPSKTVQPRFASADAENAGTVARLHHCSRCNEYMPSAESQRLRVCVGCREKGA